MILNVRARNFRSIGPAGIDLDLAPLTVLLGPNGAGKSNILRAVLMAAQASLQNLNTRGGNSILHPKNPLAPMGEESELWHKLATTEEMRFGVSTALDGLSLEREARDAVAARFPRGRALSWTVTTWTPHGYALFSHELAVDDRVVVSLVTVPTEGGWRNRGDVMDIGVIESPTGRFIIPDVWAPSNFEFGPSGGSAPPEIAKLAAKLAMAHLQALSGHVFYLSNARGIIREFGDTAGNPTSVGVHGEYVIEMLSSLSSDPARSAALEGIRKWCATFGMLDVTAGFGGANRLVGNFRDPELACVLPMHLTSFGASQILPLIVQMHAASPGDTILVEEPETSLHPDAQLTLSELLAYAISDLKLQIVMTTHNETALLGLQKPLREKRIKNLDVAAYEVTKDRDGTKAARLELVARGRIGGPISSFDRAARALYDELAKPHEEQSPPKAQKGPRARRR